MAPKRLHFLGIAGHTMRGIALAATQMGYAVTGTDPTAYPPGSDWLDAHRIQWWRNPNPVHVEGVDALIISGGTPTDDVELVAAQQQGIPVQSYAQFIGMLAADKRQIVVTGTHGKTTITSLIAWLLETAGRHPDFLVGAQPQNFDTSVRIAGGKVMVIEGDEYKASVLDTRSKFSYYQPDVLVATALEMDHPDLFHNVGEIASRFQELAGQLPPEGRMLYWEGSKELVTIGRSLGGGAASYGDSGVWHPEHVLLAPDGIDFDLYRMEVHQGHFRAPLYGTHNVDNVTAAVAVALTEGVAPEVIQKGLSSFRGAARRFEVASAPGAAITVIDDYAHHPTEIAATIEAAKQHFHRRVVAVVQPHTYSRVRELLPQYRQAVAAADVAFVTEIEGAREQATDNLSGEAIVTDNTEHVFFEPDPQRLAQRIIETVKAGDVILCMSAGGIGGLPKALAGQLTTG